VSGGGRCELGIIVQLHTRDVSSIISPDQFMVINVQQLRGLQCLRRRRPAYAAYAAALHRPVHESSFWAST